MQSTNFFAIFCGLVIAPPTTTVRAPNSRTLLAFSGESIFPSAITGWSHFSMISLRILKSSASILSFVGIAYKGCSNIVKT